MTAKDLKNALLQEAVQGKLVPQIASEGNARDLLEEIRKEKLSHGLDLRLEASLAINAKSGKRKSKKETALAGSNPCDITEDEIPFYIPESWCWCRLGELGYTTTGSTPSKSNQNYFGDFIEFLSPGDIQNSIITYGKQGLSRSGYEVSRPTPKGTILQVCIGGAIGKCAITDREVTFNQQINGLTPIFSLSEYLFAVFSSDYFYKKITGNSTGTATPIINKSAWELLPIPLPPLAEQKRIVAAIEKFMPLIEEYGKKETELKAFNEQIGTLTKKAILQEAVQGKLVPQIASEGNARNLLEEIRKEKLSHGLDLRLEASLAINAKSGKKKSKKETAFAGSNPCDITEDEIPFDIPESWCWCRITDIATCELGKTKDALKNKGEMKDYLCSINIQEEGIDLSKVKQMKFEESEYERYTVKKNDLLICEGGDAGRCAIYDRDEPMYYQNALHRVRFFYNLNPKFYLYVFQVYKANKILTEVSKGVTIQHLTGAALKELYFPLPPLAEQKRIVAAIEKLLPLCEKLGE